MKTNNTSLSKFESISDNEMLEISGGILPEWLIITVICVGIACGILGGIGDGKSS